MGEGLRVKGCWFRFWVLDFGVGRASRARALCFGIFLSSLSGFDTKSFSISKTSGNEVYYTASSLLVILKNSCSKLHCQKFFKLKSFSYQILGLGSGRGSAGGRVSRERALFRGGLVFKARRLLHHSTLGRE